MDIRNACEILKWNLVVIATFGLHIGDSKMILQEAFVWRPKMASLTLRGGLNAMSRLVVCFSAGGVWERVEKAGKKVIKKKR